MVRPLVGTFLFLHAWGHVSFPIPALGSIAPQVIVEWCVEHRRAAQSTPVEQTRRPREAIADLAREAAAGGPNFVRQQNIGILLESAGSSLRTVESALRCWAAFAEGVLGVGESHLPPTTAGLILFSRIFRNSQTYANYVSAIRMACQVAGLPTQNLYGTEVRRAQQAIARRTPPQDPKEFIQASLLRKLCRLASQEGSELFMSCLSRFVAYCRRSARRRLLRGLPQLSSPRAVRSTPDHYWHSTTIKGTTRLD